jgi:hypothetical protein
MLPVSVVLELLHAGFALLIAGLFSTLLALWSLPGCLAACLTTEQQLLAFLGDKKTLLRNRDEPAGAAG